MKYWFALSLALCQLATLSAQCAEVYFYRVNAALAGGSPVYLLYDGVTIARVDLGQRYRMELCEEGQYEFVVRTDPTDVISDRQVLDVKQGDSHYLRIGLTMGVEVVSLRNVDANKGEKDINRSAKFVGALQDLSLTNTIDVAMTGPGGPVGGPVSSPGPIGGQGSKDAVDVNNFRFQLTDVRKAGELVEMDFKITNLASTDRSLTMCNDMLSFYDESGRLYFVSKVCIANNCTTWESKSDVVRDEYYCSTGQRKAQAMMPSNIPLNASFTFLNVDRNAKQFIRGDVWFVAEQPVKFQYGLIPFPGTVDASNPNKQYAGNQAITYLNSFRRGNQVYTHFSVENPTGSPFALTVASGKAYDDQGLPHEAGALTFGNNQQASTQNRPRNGWQESIPAGGKLEFYLVFNGVARKARSLPRVDINFGSFDLQWSDVAIGTGEAMSDTGGGPKKPAPASPQESGPNEEYITYEEFKSEAPERSKVVGKRVILNDIYFDSGSDQLLSTSFPQLNDLATTLSQNAGLVIEISGHTDNVGATGSNVLLSQKRADAVRYYLIERSVSPSQMKSTGYGDSRAIADNKSAAGKQWNRRVEVRVME